MAIFAFFENLLWHSVSVFRKLALSKKLGCQGNGLHSHEKKKNVIILRKQMTKAQPQRRLNKYVFRSRKRQKLGIKV